MTLSGHMICSYLKLIITCNLWYETPKSCPAAANTAVVAVAAVADAASAVAAAAAVVAADAVDDNASVVAAAADVAADATAVFDRSQRSYFWISPIRLLGTTNYSIFFYKKYYHM